MVRRFGIFGKVFLYTLCFLLLTISITLIVFAQQVKDLYDYLQTQQYTAVFGPLKTSIVKDEGVDEIIRIASEFHDKNQSFPFNIETQDGYVVYTTLTTKTAKSTNHGESAASEVSISYDKSTPSEVSTSFGEPSSTSAAVVNSSSVKISTGSAADTAAGDTTAGYVLSEGTRDGVVITLSDGLLIRTIEATDNRSMYQEVVRKTAFILLLLLCASIAGAVLFARGITNPIRRLAEDTQKMACLQDVSLPVSRQDEVGQLSRDVHHMYEKLKDTISELQDEIAREKEMEESQRYFFSAASHELKTPIAAASALLEGMIAGIGAYRDHPKYLRECLNMMRAQNRIISEILQIVKLSDERIVPQKERVILLNVIHSLLPEYQTLADQKKQSMIIDVPEEASCHTDRRMIGSVLSNVMMNAIQNSADGEEIRIWSEIRDPDTVRLCILNTNAHIDEATQAKLFEPFYREDKARSRTGERGGLGLTIVKKILDLLGVPFALETKNTDVIFRMDLPIHE